MAYLVLCTFDLFNAGDPDYETVYADLEALGLRRCFPPTEAKKARADWTSRALAHAGRSG